MAQEHRRIVAGVVRQHAELAAFQWAQRDTLSAADPVDDEAITKIDRRLEANLDGLRLAGSAAWPFVIAQHRDFPEKGEFFLYAWLAMELGEGARLTEALAFARAEDEAVRGFAGALAWQPPQRVAPLVRDWIAAHDGLQRRLAVCACLAHRADPKAQLKRLILDPDAPVRREALRLAGLLKRVDLRDACRDRLSDEDEGVRFGAAWALAEMDAGALAAPALRKVAVGGGPDHVAALRAAVTTAPAEDVRAWMGSLLRAPETAHLAVRGSGMLGDRSLLHWLIHQMRAPTLAHAAGIAFLELFPEARDEEPLFSIEPDALGPTITDHFEGDPPYLPVADRIKDWARVRELLK